MNGVNINHQNKNGETALHTCCKIENIEVTKYILLKCNVNPNIKNSLGDTASQIAQRGQNHDLIMLLNSLHDAKLRQNRDGN